MSEPSLDAAEEAAGEPNNVERVSDSKAAVLPTDNDIEVDVLGLREDGSEFV